MSTTELTKKVRELRELQDLIAQAEAEAEAIRDEIKAEMLARSTDEMNVDVFTVRWKTVNGTRFDSTAFKNMMPDLYKQFSRPTACRRFSVV